MTGVQTCALPICHVDLFELLDLWGWASLVDGLDELTESVELLGVGDGMDLSLEDLSVLGCLHLVLVFHGLSLECLGVVLKTLNLLLFESDLEHLSGFLEVGRSSGDDGGSCVDTDGSYTCGCQHVPGDPAQSFKPVFAKGKTQCMLAAWARTVREQKLISGIGH